MNKVLQHWLLSLSVLWTGQLYAQVTISYGSNSPQVYQQGVNITPLSLTVSGDVISPAVVYGQVSTVAGSSTAGHTDDQGTSASFISPSDIAFDHSGNMYVSDFGNHLIRKISPVGAVTTIAGIADGAYGNTDGGADVARFRNPNGIAVDGSGNIYIADRNNHRIRKIDPSGQVSTLTGSSSGYADGSLSSARFSAPGDITIGSDGSLYVLEINGNRVRKIVLDGAGGGTVSTVAGAVNGETGTTDGVGTAARFTNPYSLAVDKQGNIYVADQGNNTIRKITPDGTVSTVAGAVNGDTGTADGTGVAARFNRPAGIVIDDNGDLYVSDYGNQRIRKINPTGEVSTIAGSGSGLVDGIGTAAKFKNPFGLAIDPSGNLYVADFGNNVIRRITLSGYSISPALPTGLIFDNQNGAISGTPTASSSATEYTIKAYNGTGSEVASTTLNITVNNPLPVKLKSYNLRLQTDGSVQLSWETTTEDNNKQYYLSRSTDGKVYTPIATLVAQGPNGGRYSYIDKSPREGTNYYKLEQQDQDGKTAALGIRAVTVSLDKTRSWSVYPNPVEGNDLTIVLPQGQQDRTSKQEVSIYDSAGHQLYSQVLQPAGRQLTVSLSARPVTGIYTVVVKGLGAKKVIIK